MKSLLIRQVIIEKIPKSKKEVFLDIMIGLEKKEDRYKFPNSVFFFKDGLYYFEQDLKNRKFYCRYDKVWSIFETKFHMNNEQIQAFIKHMMETHFKMKGLTPTGRMGYAVG